MNLFFILRLFFNICSRKRHGSIMYWFDFVNQWSTLREGSHYKHCITLQGLNQIKRESKGTRQENQKKWWLDRWIVFWIHTADKGLRAVFKVNTDPRAFSNCPGSWPIGSTLKNYIINDSKYIHWIKTKFNLHLSICLLRDYKYCLFRKIVFFLIYFLKIYIIF